MAPVSFLDRTANIITDSESTRSQITLGQYVFERLLSCGTRTVFGVPGDFNLSLLEHMYDEEIENQGLKWVGTCNELNAAYAADGYSRYTNNIGCVITTFGVGELSALNGLAGAFAEDVKVLHIVGVTPSKFHTDAVVSHHNVHHLVPALKNSNFEAPLHHVYHDMVKDRISCSTEFLDNLETACDQIDKVISDIFRHSKPGYIFIPADFADKLVDPVNLFAMPTINLDMVLSGNVFDERRIQIASDLLLQLIYKSKAPAVIGDVLCDRFGCTNQLREFVQKTQMWNFSSMMGRSILDESKPTFRGVYNGSESESQVSSIIQNCDLILHFGAIRNEMNTGHYSFSFSPNSTIVEIHPDYFKIYDSLSGKKTHIEGFPLKSFLQTVIECLDVQKLNFGYPDVVKKQAASISYDPDSPVTQSNLQLVFPKCLNPGDIFVTETGSFQFAVRDFVFPSNLKYISQGFYLSIGMALPAALGIGCGMVDYPRQHINEVENTVPKDYIPRLVLTEGDGAAQMTIQELSSFLRYNIPLEIFIWNNDGYTVERAIKGPTRAYNDIMPWNWTKILHALGDISETKTQNCKIETFGQLSKHLNALKLNDNRATIKLLEVKLERMDIPEQLKIMAKACRHT